MNRLANICLGLSAACFIQAAKAQIYFQEDFEQITISGKAASLPDSWTLYSDGNQADGDFKYLDEAWKVIKIQNDRNQVAAATSWFTNRQKTADRWMITPEIDLSSTTTPYLFFDIRSADKIDLENCDIRISTDGTEKTAFTDTVLQLRQIAADWQTQAIDLSPYRDQKIHIAFILCSKDKYALYIDDITVEELKEPIVHITDLLAPVTVGIDSLFDIDATAYFRCHKPVTSYTVRYAISEDCSGQQAVTSASIANLERVSIHIGDIRLSEAGAHTLRVWLSDINGETINSDTATRPIEITNSQFYTKNALLEIFSSATCGPCAKANPYIKAAYTTLGANKEKSKLHVIKYQQTIPASGDPAATSETSYRFAYYDGGGVPHARLNGKNVSGNWDKWPETLPQQVAEENTLSTPFQTTSQMQRQETHFSIDVAIDNVGSYKNPVLLYVALIEDSIHHDPISNGETDFFYVVRKLLPDAYGESLHFTQSGRQNIRYEHHFLPGSKPAILHLPEGVSAVVLLQDSVTKEILQSERLQSIAQNPNEDLTACPLSTRVYPNPCRDHCTVEIRYPQAGTYRLTLTQTDGRTYRQQTIAVADGGEIQTTEISLQDLPAGLYLLRIEGHNLLYKTHIIKF